MRQIYNFNGTLVSLDEEQPTNKAEIKKNTQ